MFDYNIFSCPLFFHLPENEIDELLDRSVTEVREVDKGNYVVRQGDTIHSIFIC